MTKDGDSSSPGAMEERVSFLLSQIEEKEKSLHDLELQVAHKESILREIYGSKSFRLVRILCSILDQGIFAYRRLTRWLAKKFNYDPDAGSDLAKVPRGRGWPDLPPAKGYDVVCFPIIDWEFRYQRPQQLMARFARAGHRVFYFRTTTHLKNLSVSCEEICERVYGVQLPGSSSLNVYQDDLGVSACREYMAAFAEFKRWAQIHDALCVVQLPFWVSLAHAAREHWGWRVVYDCMDEHGGFSTNSSTMVDNEESLLRNSDLVVTTARVLKEKASKYTDRLLHLPNAVDYDHFHIAGSYRVNPTTNVPVVGYYGAISDWFDVEMIASAVRDRKDWEFVLVGSTYGADISDLQGHANLWLLGEKPYCEIPNFLHGFSVACIPFLHNELTRATNPVKFFEYMAAGKPVVAVDLPELAPFRNHYYSVEEAGGFIPAVERALAEDCPEKIAARQAFAAGHTWEARYRELDRVVTAMYGRVAIVIVSYGCLDYLQQCLTSIRENTVYPNYEVIIVDNASAPEVVEYLTEAAAQDDRIKVILNQENVGFAAGNNQAIRAVPNAELLVLLNNDTIVTPGWLLGLTRYLRLEEVGMVGPVTNWCGNEAKIDVTYDKPAGINDFAHQYTGKREGLYFDISVLAMYCVAFRRQLYDQVGELDERFGVGMFEDDDFCVRVHEAGYKVICAEDVFVHHWGQGSFGKLERPEYNAIFARNRKLYEEKWGREWVLYTHRTWDQEAPPPGVHSRFRLLPSTTPEKEKKGVD